MTNFQIIIISIFVVLAVMGVIIFAGVGGIAEKDGKVGKVEIWGTIPKDIINGIISDMNIISNGRFSEVKYIEKNKTIYEEEFIEALAAGAGPDLFLLAHNSIVRNRNKIIEIPYDTITEREFKNTFIEESEMFLTENGILGLPFTIDPMVMYWNRDIFQTAGIANPPQFWDEMFILSPKITRRDAASNIKKSFTALGEFNNVENAKEILSVLIMQSGNKIVIQSEGGFQSIIDDRLDFATPPAEAALRFYTEFSNPVKSIYSWNRALPNSKQAFAAGDLSVYFGFASELKEIIRSNPNLNFGLNPLPQLRDSDVKITYGKMNAFAIPKNSQNKKDALSVLLSFTNMDNISIYSQKSGLPPVRRDLLANKPSDAINSVFYDSALMSKSWFDPDDKQSDDIFKNMIESVTSGKARLKEAISIADQELDALLRNR